MGYGGNWYYQGGVIATIVYKWILLKYPPPPWYYWVPTQYFIVYLTLSLFMGYGGNWDYQGGLWLQLFTNEFSLNIFHPLLIVLSTNLTL